MTGPEESAAEVMRDLISRHGLSQRAIADVLGRNSSYISQILKGRKGPRGGEHHRATLDAMRARLDEAKSAGHVQPSREQLAAELPHAERRKTKSGQAARTRKVVRARESITATVQGKAARQGARSLLRLLRQADEAGMSTAWTLRFRERFKGGHNVGVKAQGKSSRKGGKSSTGAAGQGVIPSVPAPSSAFADWMSDPSELVRVVDEQGITLTQALVDEATAMGLISFAPSVNPIRDLISIELRAW